MTMKINLGKQLGTTPLLLVTSVEHPRPRTTLALARIMPRVSDSRINSNFYHLPNR
jgi:hypothetical protein